MVKLRRCYKTWFNSDVDALGIRTTYYVLLLRTTYTYYVYVLLRTTYTYLYELLRTTTYYVYVLRICTTYTYYVYVLRIRIRTTYYYVLLRTTTYYYVLLRTTYTYYVYVLRIRIRTTYYYVRLRTTTYYYVLLRTTTYYYVLLRTTTYYYVLRIRTIFNNAELSGIYQELGCWYLLSDWPPEVDPTDPWRGMLGVMYVNPQMWIFTQSNAHTYIWQTQYLCLHTHADLAWTRTYIQTYSYTYTWLQMVRPPQPTHRGGAGTLCVHVVSLCADTKTMTCRPCWDTHILTYKQTINQYKQIVIIHKSIQTYSYTYIHGCRW